MPQLNPIQPQNITRFITGLFSDRNPLIPPLTTEGDGFDALIDGLNMELSEHFTWQRRAGFDKWNTQVLAAGEIPRRMVSFRNLAGTIRLVSDLTANVSVVTTTTKTILFTLTGSTAVSFQSVADTLYMANAAELKKWDGTTLTTWGIATPVTAPTITPQAGALSPTVGYTYVYVYKNSSTGHISTASPVSASTGPQTSKQFLIEGTDTSDTQVDKVEIYRTKDGGSLHFFLTEIAEAPSWSFVDTIADSALNTGLVAPQGNANDPPPAGLENITFWQGLMWGSVDGKVFYGGGAAVTNGIPEEAWPPLRFFLFPARITALIPSRGGLLVFTASDTFIIRGMDSISFFAEVWRARLGVLNSSAVTFDGDTMYVYTANRELLAIGQSITDIGHPINDILDDLFPPASTHVIIHRTGGEQGALYVSNGTSTYLRFFLQGRSWSPKAVPDSGVKMLATVETSAGVYDLILGRPAGSDYLLKRNTAVWSDDGEAFAAWMTFGSISLATEGQLVALESIFTRRTASGSEPTLGLRLNEVSGAFATMVKPVDEPPQLPGLLSVIQRRYYLNSMTLHHLCQHFQLKVSFATADQFDELSGLGFGAKPLPT